MFEVKPMVSRATVKQIDVTKLFSKETIPSPMVSTTDDEHTADARHTSSPVPRHTAKQSSTFPFQTDITYSPS